RGFNVVAQEVRKLSEQSQRDTKKAEESITHIRKEIELIESHSKEGIKKTSSGMETLGLVHQVFDEIYDTITSVNTHKDQLVRVSEDLKKSTETA
ncbi:hypothetical protein DXT76_20670, partial [Halobacillus trueperi]